MPPKLSRTEEQSTATAGKVEIGDDKRVVEGRGSRVEGRGSRAIEWIATAVKGGGGEANSREEEKSEAAHNNQQQETSYKIASFWRYSISASTKTNG